MTQFSRPSLIQTTQDNEGLRRYADVWRRLVILAIAAGVVAFALQGIRLLSPALLLEFKSITLNSFLALFPGLLWSLLSWLEERHAAEPRSRMLPLGLAVFVGAYALILPFNGLVFSGDTWLPLASAVDRILGYTFTIGILQAGFIYGSIIALVWRSHIRSRQDAPTYCVTSAIAFASAENLFFLTATAPTLDAAAIRFFGNLAVSVSCGLIIAYGLTRTRFDAAPSFLMPLTLVIGAALIGVSIPLQSGLLSASLSLEPTSPRPFFALGLAAAILSVGMFIINSLLTSAERRAMEAESIESLDILR